MATATATAAPPVIDLSDPRLLAWCRGIARGIRSDFRFIRGQSEEQELEAVALAEMVAAAVGEGRFDPGRVPAGGDLVGAFKGYAHPAIKFEVIRAAKELRTGGVHVPRRERKGAGPVRVTHLSALETPTGRDGDGVEVADLRVTARPDVCPPAPEDPGRPARVLPADLPPAAHSRPAPPAPLAAFDAYLASLSADLQRDAPGGVPAAFAGGYRSAVRGEMVAAEEARGCLERLLTLAARHADLGAAVRQVLAETPGKVAAVA